MLYYMESIKTSVFSLVAIDSKASIIRVYTLVDVCATVQLYYNSNMRGNPDASDLVVRTDICQAQFCSLHWICTSLVDLQCEPCRLENM